MTTPGGFEQGEDFVAARLSIDVPSDGVAGLRELSQEMDRFRTSAEAGARSADNFARYVNEMAEAESRAATATQNLISLMERQAGISTGMSTGTSMMGAAPPTMLNAPAQYANPFVGMALGMGAGRMAMGGMDFDGVQGGLDNLRQSDPRGYLNKMAASGHYRAGDLPATAAPEQIRETAERIHARDQQQATVGGGAAGDLNALGGKVGRFGSIASQVMNEMGPGGQPMGGAGMLQRGLSGLGRLSGAVPAGGAAEAGAGTAMSALGRVAMGGAGVVGAGLAGYGLVQGAGGMYQDYRNMGLQRGGGAAEGVGYEMNVRSMAMNPFLSTEQARAIVQGGLKDGYTGKEFDTMTSFVADNLKEFNMSIADSFAMVRKNVKEGGQSLASFSSAMETLKGMSQTGYRSLPELQQSYGQTSSALISTGMSGPQASQAALAGGGMFANNQMMAGAGEQTMTAFATNPANMAMMMTQGGLNMPPGVTPLGMPFMLESEGLGQGSENVLKKMAMMQWNAVGKPKPGTPMFYEAVGRWALVVRQMGMPWANDNTKVKEYFTALVTGGHPFQEGQKKAADQQEKDTQVRERGTGEATGALLGGIGGMFKEGVGMITDTLSGKYANLGERGGAFGRAYDQATGNTSPLTGRNSYEIPMLNQIEAAYGRGGYEVLDSSGKPVKLDRANKEQMDALSGGQYTWRPKGTEGKGVSLSDTPMQDVKSAGGTQKVEGQVTIGLTPEAQKLLQPQGGVNTIKLTPHEQQANSGYSQATPNNAPPGYQYPRSRYAAGQTGS